MLTLSWTFGQTVENQPKSERYGSWAQMANMAGVRKLQPNLRVQPMVIDPFAINELDYYLVSHFHSDHIDPYTAAAILNNPKLEHVKFIGPYHCGRIWEGWGVPKNVSSLLNQVTLSN